MGKEEKERFSGSGGLQYLLVEAYSVCYTLSFDMLVKQLLYKERTHEIRCSGKH